MTKAPKTGIGARFEDPVNRKMLPGDSFASLGMTSAIGPAYRLAKTSVIASRKAAHPRVASLAPSGQFTFWQSRGPQNVPLKIHGIATGYALAMTWEWGGLSKSTIFPMGFSCFYHEIFVDFLTICDTMRKSANADNSLLPTRLGAIKTIRRCKQHG